MTHKNIFVPKAVTAFKCQMCGKCCGGWQINLSQKEYAFLEENIEAIDRSINNIEKTTEVLPENIGSDEKYARFIFNDKGKCFFLDDTQNCKWFSVLGKDKGSFVCQTFPVFNFLTPKGQFYNISFFCTSASLLLFDFDFNFGVFDRENTFIPYKKDISDFTKQKFVQAGLGVFVDWEAYYDMEAMFAGFYANKDINFENKLFLIVHFVSLLYLSREKKINKDVFTAFHALFKTKKNIILDELSDLSGDVVYQLENIKHILYRRKSLYPNTKSFVKLLKKADIFLKDTTLGSDAFLEKYAKYNQEFRANNDAFEKYFFSKIVYNILMVENGISAGLKIAVWLYLAVRFFTILRMEEDSDFKEVFLSAVYDVEKYFFHDRKIFSFWSRSTDKEPCVLSMDIIRMVKF